MYITGSIVLLAVDQNESVATNRSSSNGYNCRGKRTNVFVSPLPPSWPASVTVSVAVAVVLSVSFDSTKDARPSSFSMNVAAVPSRGGS